MQDWCEQRQSSKHLHRLLSISFSQSYMICLNKGGGGLSSSSPSSDADPLTSFFNLNQVVLIDSDLYSNYARHLLNDDDDNKLESISAPSVLVDYKNESLFRFEHALTYKTMSIK